MSDLDGTDDVFDSRDVIERIEALQTNNDDNSITVAERDELDALLAFAAEGESAPDWRYGVTFIRDTYFGDYARELAEETGAINANASWPLYAIDWERAARDLQMDYTNYELCDVTYWAAS